MTDSRRISDAGTSGSRTSSAGSSPPISATAATLAIGGQSASISRLTSTGDLEIRLPFQLAGTERPSLKVSDLDGLSQRSLYGRTASKRSSDSGMARSVPPPARDRAAPTGPPTLYPEATGHEPNLQVDHRRSLGNRVLRGALGALGALALGGAVVGGAVLLGMTGFPVVAAVGVVGVLVVAAAWKAGTALADYCFVQPQAKHLDDAITELTIGRGGLTEQESRNLGALTDKQWRKLLHVPSSKLIRLKSQVNGPKRRQKIRQALVRHIAVTGDDDSAEKLKTRLTLAANQPSPPDHPDLALDAEIAVVRLETICQQLGLEAAHLPEDAEREVVEKASNPDLVVEDQWISAFLVSRLASQAADRPGRGRDDLAADRRAAYAVVAHQARYAPREAFLSATAPGSASLTSILDRYRGEQLDSRLEQVRRQVGVGRAPTPRPGALWQERHTQQAIANLDATMGALVGDEGHLRDAVAQVPRNLRALLREMARAAEPSGLPYQRLALFHGLAGGNLSSGPASGRARGGQRSSRDLMRSKLVANEALARSTFEQSAGPEHAAPRREARYRAGEVAPQDHELKLDLFAGSSSGDESSSDDDRGPPQPAPHQETLADAQARWAPQVSAFVEALIAPSSPSSGDGLP